MPILERYSLRLFFILPLYVIKFLVYVITYCNYCKDGIYLFSFITLCNIMFMNNLEVVMSFIKNLKEARKAKKLSQAELAKVCADIDKQGWSQSRIAHYERGTRLPDLHDLEVLSIALSVEPSRLAFDENVSFVEGIENVHYYPVLNTVQAGAWTGIQDCGNNEEYEMLPSTIKASRNSFLLRIKGDSMFDKFKEGDLILVDPDIRPTPGRFVVAINGGDEATFKQYYELGEFDEYGNQHFELVPYNKVYPTLSSKNQPIRIIGVAIRKFSEI